MLGFLRDNPAGVEGVVDDRVLDVLDGDGRLVDAQNARALARRRTHAARELGEVVRLQQHDESLAPVLAVHEVVPLGNDVAEGTAVVRLTKWNAAVHAAETTINTHNLNTTLVGFHFSPCRLHAQVLLHSVVVKHFIPIAKPLLR